MASDPPLDEVQWSNPPLAGELKGIHTNTVLPYFAESPFFDRTSNNAVVTTQALYNPAMLYLVQTRAAFERHLASMSGLEFVVAHDPSRGDTVHEHSGVWVIRKQTRRKRGGGLEDEITPVSAYFVVGESIYMAPTMENVIGCRLLSTVDSLTKLVAAASSLPLFTPALGHTWTTPRQKPVTGAAAAAAGSSVAPTQASDAGTPQPDTQSVSSVPCARASSRGDNDDARGAKLLADSLSLLQRFGGEYMDEHPLVGEPGSFKLDRAKDGGAGPGRRIALKGGDSGAPTADELGGTEEDGATGDSAGRASAPLPPPPIKTDLASEVHKKIKGAEKSPLTPGGVRKRKKNKIQTPKTPK